MSTMISIIKNNRLIAVLTFLVAVAVLAAALYFSFGLLSAKSASVDAADADAAFVDAADTTDALETVVTNLSIARVEFDALAEQSSLVVRGTVSDVTDLLLIQGVQGGDPAYFINSYFDVLEVYRGETDGASIPIRELCTQYLLQEDGSVSEASLSSATLLPGEEYILFLYKPNYGGGWNTADDFFQIVGFNQGAFLREEVDVFRNASYEEALYAESIAQEMATINEATPIDYDFHKKLLEEGLQANFESGFITEQYYEQALEEQGLYATIIG